MRERASPTVEIDRIALRRWREERMVSQGDLARLAGMSIVSVNRLEVGNRTRTYRSTVRRLAAALGGAPLDLLIWNEWMYASAIGYVDAKSFPVLILARAR